MSLFNVIVVKTECPWCGKSSTMDVQFKYGKVWQYEYRVGDALVWPECSENASEKRTRKISGVAIPCRFCVKDFIDFEIVIENNIIKSVSPLALTVNARSQEITRQGDKSKKAASTRRVRRKRS